MNIVAGVGRELHALFEDFDALGIRNANAVYWNLTTGALYEEAVRRSEGLIAHHARWLSGQATTRAVRLTISSSSTTKRPIRS